MKRSRKKKKHWEIRTHYSYTLMVCETKNCGYCRSHPKRGHWGEDVDSLPITPIPRPEFDPGRPGHYKDPTRQLAEFKYKGCPEFTPRPPPSILAAQIFKTNLTKEMMTSRVPKWLVHEAVGIIRDARCNYEAISKYYEHLRLVHLRRLEGAQKAKKTRKENSKKYNTRGGELGQNDITPKRITSTGPSDQDTGNKRAHQTKINGFLNGGHSKYNTSTDTEKILSFDSSLTNIQKHYVRLAEGQYLSDFLIDLYVHLNIPMDVKKQVIYMPCGFDFNLEKNNYQSCRRWVRKLGTNIFDTTHIIFHIHDNLHFSCVAITGLRFLKEHIDESSGEGSQAPLPCVLHCDSIPNYHDRRMRGIFPHLVDFVLDSWHEHYPHETSSQVDQYIKGKIELLRVEVPEQPNLTECGVYSLCCHEQLQLKRPLLREHDIQVQRGKKLLQIDGFSSDMFDMTAIRRIRINFKAQIDAALQSRKCTQLPVCH